MKIVQPTPTPWAVKVIKEGLLAIFQGDRIICEMPSFPMIEIELANASFIVTAANCHEYFIRAARRAIMALAANDAPNCESVKELTRVLKLAGIDPVADVASVA